MTTTQKSSGTCPCCCDTAPLQQTANELPPNEIASDTQLCGGDAIKRLGKKPIDALRALTEAPELLDTAAATFAMTQTHKLTKSALGLWNLHKEVIDDTLEGGWDNPTHGWNRSVQNFWKYPTFFGIYAIPSLVMICPEMLDEAAEYMRKSILLSRDTPVWDGWIRQGFSDDPICRRNIMYKGHVVLACGLYHLMSGRTEFEETLKEVMDVIVKELQYDGPLVGNRFTSHNARNSAAGADEHGNETTAGKANPAEQTV